MDKHLFIINPTAGKRNPCESLIQKIESLNGDHTVSYCVTKAPGHAGTLVREALAALPSGDRLRVYACGGDGTLFEAVNGGVGHPSFSVTAVPVGSGNDFIKTFPAYSKSDFLDLERLVFGKLHRIDSLRVGSYTSLNIISAGFDAQVCRSMVKYKDLPLVSGSMAYKLALIDALIKSRRNYFRLLADGEEIEDGTHPHLLAIAANGCYYGGGFKASPTSRPDDGFMDVITVPTISVPRLARFIGVFRRGEHVDNAAMPFVNHSVRHELQFCSPSEVILNVDGEMISMHNPKITLAPHSVDVILPAES